MSGLNSRTVIGERYDSRHVRSRCKAASVPSVREFVHLRREISPRDAFAAMAAAALPVEPPSPNVHLAQLLAARVDVELETTPRLRELRHVEVHVDGVLPLDVLRL